ncbi:protein GVQW3 [Trichonephila clavipes]|nr:protein GVQW3 [Trichonephila clavipes]
MWLYARGPSDQLKSVVGPLTLITLHSVVACWLWLRQDHAWRRCLQKSVCKFKMQQSIVQHYAIKFCVRLGKSDASTLEMIQQTYSRESLSLAQVFRWHKMFKEGRENMEDEPSASPPSTSRTAENEQRLRHLLNTDQRLSVPMITEQLGMDKMVVHKIISEDLGMRKICAKLVPKVLTDVKNQNREAVSKDLLERIEEDPHFFDNVITEDESWFSFSTIPRQNIKATNGILRNRLDRRKLACPSRE